MRLVVLGLMVMFIVTMFILPSTPKAHATGQQSGFSAIYNFGLAAGPQLSDESVVFANNRFWAFWTGYDGDFVTQGDFYMSSADGGVTWGPQPSFPSVFPPGIPISGSFETVYLVGTKAYIIRTVTGETAFHLRAGTLNGDGTITWAFGARSVNVTAGHVILYGLSFVDRVGNWYAVITTTQGGIFFVEVWKSTDAGSSWNLASTITGYRVYPFSPVGSLMFELANTHLALTMVNAAGAIGYVTISSNGGTTWGTPVAPTVAWSNAGGSSASIGNVVYYSGGSSSTQYVVSSYTDGAGSWSAGVQVQGANSANAIGMICTESNSAKLSVFFAASAGEVETNTTDIAGLTSWTTPFTMESLTVDGPYCGSPINGFTYGIGTGANSGLGNLYFMFAGPIGPGTVIVVIPCTAFELQCWLYPMFFFGTYLILILGIAKKGNIPDVDIKGFALEAFTIASLLAVIMGMMSVMIPLLVTIVQVIRMIRA